MIHIELVLSFASPTIIATTVARLSPSGRVQNENDVSEVQCAFRLSLIFDILLSTIVVIRLILTLPPGKTKPVPLTFWEVCSLFHRRATITGATVPTHHVVVALNRIYFNKTPHFHHVVFHLTPLLVDCQCRDKRRHRSTGALTFFIELSPSSE